ncbi:nuclear transport factor 2 family protein [Planctobacterium marinum]
MKKVISILILLCLASFTSYAANQLTEQQIKNLTQDFIAAKNARQQPDSDEEDVEHFLSFIADEFKDEHLKFNVTVTSKEELRAGMLAKLEDKIIFSSIEILEMMIGSNVVFVKFKEHAKGQPAHLDKPIEYSAINIMSLEFTDSGKIKHIRRHHGL